MDANGTRFCLLLGEDDWGRCRFVGEHLDVLLRQAWSDRRDGVEASPPANVALDWDAQHDELTLRARRAKFVAAPADVPVTPDERRGVAADRYANIYWIDATRTKVLVRSSGSGNVSEFWPGGLDLPPAEHGDFTDSRTATAPARRFAGVAVTHDHFLAVGMTEPPGLLVFDLMAGGAPVEMRWPALPVPFEPVDLAARPGCGVWILDRANRYWALDRRFGVVNANQPEILLADPGPDEFQPVDGGSSRQRPSVHFPGGHLVDASASTGTANAIAIEALPGGEALVLDRAGSPSRSRVLCFRDGRRVGEDRGGVLDFDAHDFVFVPGATKTAVGRLFIVSAEGNQAFAFDVILAGDDFRLTASAEFHPMRRFGGKGLVLVAESTAGTHVHYDFGDSWVPLVRQHRARFDEEAQLVTPVFDSGEPECTWHRFLLDAQIPPDTSVEVWSRAADETDGVSGGEGGVANAAWRREPRPYLRTGGSELPWTGSRRGCGAGADGDGTWEFLFQHAKGRYLQLRLVLRGNGRATPRLRAMRAWYPRFSYLEHYLPAVYREDAESASFLGRFLANFEGTLTAAEDRIVAVQALFDVRSAPADALAWLADWFGVAIDPAWDERRQRLFIRHAMAFFQYRGTVHGLKMALRLAFDPCIDDDDLGPPREEPAAPESIRIVENYRLRKAPPVVFGQPADLAGPRVVEGGAQWSPAEGNAGLVSRYYAKLGRKPTDRESIAFPLASGDIGTDEERAHWKAFLRETFGSVPQGGSDERTRWQQFLAAQSEDLAAMNLRHGTAHSRFADIALPVDEPAQPKLAEDWKAFVTATAALPDAQERTRWQDFLAQRYRRVEALNARHGTRWSSFAWVALPDRLPADGAALEDWLRFELKVQPMFALAHSFRVLLPTPAGGIDPVVARRRLDLAQRIVDLEKPAHTVFDVRFYWAMFRIGDARLGIDTLLDQGSRAPQLLPDTLLGRGFVGTSFVADAGPKSEPGRMALVC